MTATQRQPGTATDNQRRFGHPDRHGNMTATQKAFGASGLKFRGSKPPPVIDPAADRIDLIRAAWKRVNARNAWLMRPVKRRDHDSEITYYVPKEYADQIVVEDE